jgi:hypothetical protein
MIVNHNTLAGGLEQLQHIIAEQHLEAGFNVVFIAHGDEFQWYDVQ